MKYFKTEELACKCCGVDETTDEFKQRLNELRSKFGFPMKVNCAYRCEKHNKEVGGEDNSYHVKGMAVDIHCPNGAFKGNLAKTALNYGWTVGVYSWGLHLDIRYGNVMFWGKY